MEHTSFSVATFTLAEFGYDGYGLAYTARELTHTTGMVTVALAEGPNTPIEAVTVTVEHPVRTAAPEEMVSTVPVSVAHAVDPAASAYATRESEAISRFEPSLNVTTSERDVEVGSADGLNAAASAGSVSFDCDVLRTMLTKEGTAIVTLDEPCATAVAPHARHTAEMRGPN